jgi:hypothetical protein
MRIYGNLSDRQFEVHLYPDWSSPTRVEVIWTPDLENPRNLKKAFVVLYTWTHEGGDQVPSWLMQELRENEKYLLRELDAFYKK